MTLPLPLRRGSRRPVAALVQVTNHWRVRYAEDGSRVHLRECLVRNPDGTLHTRYLPDAHPALVSYLGRMAAAVAA